MYLDSFTQTKILDSEGRITVIFILFKCTFCIRFNSNNLESSPVHLEENQVKVFTVFKITGVDMESSLFLKDNINS